MDEAKSIVNRLQAQLLAGASPADLFVTAGKLCHVLGQLQPKPAQSSSVSVVMPAGYSIPSEATLQQVSVPNDVAWQHAQTLLAATEAFLPTSQNSPGLTSNTSQDADPQTAQLTILPFAQNSTINTDAEERGPMGTANMENVPKSILTVPRPPAQTTIAFAHDDETAIERLIEEEMVPFESENSDDEPLVVELVVDEGADEANDDICNSMDVLEAPPTLSRTMVETMAPKTVMPSRDLHTSLPVEVTERNQALGKPATELAELLARPKIKDLRKAISINDKFRLVHELFRDDEAMFERSLKTLNNFGTLQEAAYWTQRELVVKLGWEDDNEMVQFFYDMLKRRFD